MNVLCGCYFAAHCRCGSYHCRDRITGWQDLPYDRSFDAVFEAEDMDVLLSAPRAPRMNAHCERVIGTVRREASTTSCS